MVKIYYSFGCHFIQRSGTVWAILIEGLVKIMGFTIFKMFIWGGILSDIQSCIARECFLLYIQ